MINNRQNGRRRGRGGGGGQRQGGGGGQGQRDSGNRIDSRARGNAAQLLEKYRNMARDAQMAGDRVNTEYYLQFADHYFRVLADQRGRSEDQQPRRMRDDFDQFDQFDGGDDFADEGDAIRADELPRGSEGDGRPVRDRDAPRPQREERQSRDREDRRPPREDRAEPRFQRAAEPANDLTDAPVEAADAGEGQRRRRTRKPREERGEERIADAGQDGGGDVALGADRLPPALGVTGGEDAEQEAEAPKPRRRRVRTAAAEAPQVG